MGEHIHELLHVSAATLFVVACVSSLVDYQSLRERVVLSYSVMCFAAGIYAAHVVVSHNLPKMGTFWIPWTLVGLTVTFVATLCYLTTMGEFLRIRARSYFAPLAIQAGIGVFVLGDLISYGVRDRSLLFAPVPREALGAHQSELGEAAYSLLPAAEVVAALFMLSFVVGVVFLLVHLIRTRSRDPLLYLGLVATVAFIVNDTLVALSQYEGMYLLAFSKTFEAVRIRRDIRLRAQERIERRLRHAENMQSIGRVAGGIAHDFGNILTAIGGSVELAADSLDEKDPIRSDLKTAEDGVHRGRQLVHQLLDVARSRETEAERIDVGQFLSESAKLLEGVLSKGIRLELAVEPDVGQVRISPGQLTQVLINLVVNARDAMREGGKLTILACSRPDRSRPLRSSAGNSLVTISVIDEGEGIPTDVINHIFEPLFTTKTERGGTGIGLATLYSIVHQAGGTVEVNSQTGRGTRFDVILPRLDA